MMFIEAASWLFEWAQTHGRSREVFGLDRIVSDSASRFRRNFFRRGHLTANQPSRRNHGNCPRTVIGVCVEHDYRCSIGRPLDPASAIGMLHHDGRGHYVCGTCFDAGGYSGPEIPAMEIGAVLLTPSYLGSSLFQDAELLRLARRYAAIAKATPNRVVTGHEPSLRLYTLIRTGGTRAEIEAARRDVMAYRSSLGSWDEYYSGGISRTTRNRPWETGYALEALLEYEEWATRHPR
jgi:hypothetical protein